MKNFIAPMASFIFLFTFNVSFLSAHDVYKEPLEERYGLKTVSCKTCHPNTKDRSIHNVFGQYFADEFKGQEITIKYEEAKAAGEEQQAA